jgi:hypothetical protein
MQAEVHRSHEATAFGRWRDKRPIAELLGAMIFDESFL